MHTSPTSQGSEHQFENNPRLPAPPQHPLTGRFFPRGVGQLWQCVSPWLCETEAVPTEELLGIPHITQGEDEATSLPCQACPSKGQAGRWVA